MKLAGPGHLSLRLVHHYRIGEDPAELGLWKVNTAAYYYVLDDRDGQQIISYHWHPESSSPIRLPHLHVGPAAGCAREELATAHCPTGLISIQEFLQFAVVDFRVEPLRADWRDVFAEAGRNFQS